MDRNKIDHGKIVTPEELRAEVQKAVDESLEMVPRAELADLRAKLAAAKEQAAHYKAAAEALFEQTKRMEDESIRQYQQVETKLAAATERAEKAERERQAYASDLRREEDVTSELRKCVTGAITRAEAAEAEREALRAKLKRTERDYIALCEKSNADDAETQRICREFQQAAFDRDALASQNAALRAALDKIAGPPIEPDFDGLMEDATCTYCEQSSLEGCTEDCPRTIAADVLALTPPAALEALRRRERSIGAEEELRRLADERGGQWVHPHELVLRADAIAAERDHIADAGKKVEGEEK